MESKTQSISEVFSMTRTLQVPFYQRQYVWTSKEWERFVDDMYSLIETDNDYFLGALILKDENVPTSEKRCGIRDHLSIVDGQQRLTTLSIFMKVLHTLTGTTDEFIHQFMVKGMNYAPRILHNINDRAAFNTVMGLEVLTEEVPNYEDNNIVCAYHYFVEELRRRGQLSDLLNAIYSHIGFVEIKLDAKDDERQIFETINGIGIDLTTDEMLKNFLYSIDEEELYVNEWKPAFDVPEARNFWGTDDASRRQAKTKDTKTIETFILHFVKIQMWKYKDRFEPNARKKLVAKNDLYNSCKSFVTRYGEDRITLAREIIEYSRLYRKYFDKQLLNQRIPTQASIERLACYAMVKESTIIPYLLYILRTVADAEEQTRIFDYLERYLMRRIVSMPNKKNKNFVEFFSETLIGSETNTYEKLRSRLEGMNLTDNHVMPTAEMIADNISKVAIEPEIAKLFLYMMESKFESVEGLGWNQYEVEAIMPKPSADNEDTWAQHDDEAQEDLRKKRARTIGNYLLLKSDSPSFADSIKEASNLAWADKRPRLVSWSCGNRTSQWFNSVREWNEDGILARNAQLAEFINTHFWSIGAAQ